MRAKRASLGGRVEKRPRSKDASRSAATGYESYDAGTSWLLAAKSISIRGASAKFSVWHRFVRLIAHVCAIFMDWTPLSY